MRLGAGSLGVDAQALRDVLGEPALPAVLAIEVARAEGLGLVRQLREHERPVPLGVVERDEPAERGAHGRERRFPGRPRREPGAISSPARS